MAKCCNFNRTYIEVVALGRGTFQMKGEKKQMHGRYLNFFFVFLIKFNKKKKHFKTFSRKIHFFYFNTVAKTCE